MVVGGIEDRSESSGDGEAADVQVVLVLDAALLMLSDASVEYHCCKCVSICEVSGQSTGQEMVSVVLVALVARVVANVSSMEEEEHEPRM